MNVKPVIICLTPVKNEAWILDAFLQCTSLWADYIIIADQQSTDGSRDVALKYPKVTLIDNPLKEYDEIERQKLLLVEARKISGKKLLITLDADEFFTSDFAQTEEWKEITQAQPGEIFGFQWLNLLPGYKKAWLSEGYFPWAYMDDGKEHQGSQMHNPRVPVTNWNSIINIEKIKVLHFQYVNWIRMESKHRYYQCLERIKYPYKSPVEVYRTYHHMYNIPKNRVLAFENNWIDDYVKLGINTKQIEISGKNWFDNEVEKLMNEHGAYKFKKESIWQHRWAHKDPRSIIDKIVHYYWKLTQPYVNNKIVQKIDYQLRFHFK